MSGVQKKTVRDLTTGSLFKLTFFSCLGIYFLILPLLIISLSFAPVAPDSAAPSPLVIVILALGNMFLGPCMFALYALLGRWAYFKAFKSAELQPIEFLSDDERFETITRESLMKALALCFKGVFIVFGCVFFPFWVLFVITSLFSMQFHMLGIVVLQMLMLSVMYFIAPWVWAFFMSLSSLLSKPLVRKLGWGKLQFKES